jgi:aminoglycoside N3'-acetyltransferase/GNAT superfamily N-acetyltransferase
MSFRAVRPVEGGPLGLIEALRVAVGPEGTVVMPSWTEDDDAVFDPAASRAAASLGVTADMFWRIPGVRRSEHPFALAAIGPRAEEITADPLPIPPSRPESPIGRVHELDGQILLLGVGHDSNTTIHLAEIITKVPYGVPKHCTIAIGGVPVRIDYAENDHCCQRFALADQWLRARGLQREGQVGNAHARLVCSRDVVGVGREQLARDPLVFLHGAEDGCEECAEARRSVAPTLTVAREEILSPTAYALMSALNAELTATYPEPGATHFRLDADEVSDGRGAFLVVRRSGQPVACGAVRRLEDGSGELKRMYVAPGERGRGVGRTLLAGLEDEARELGISRLVLETGIRQSQAITLYRRAGFEPIPAYGEYALSPGTSVCMAKNLDDAAWPSRQ